MKVRLDGKSIRLRLSDSEAAHLASTGEVSVKTAFPNGRALMVRLEAAELDAPPAGFDDDTVLVRLPARAVRQWASSDQVGIYFDIQGLGIAVEKDLRECRR
ncbi:MAG TPA: hypothetical protein VFL57_16040 [Bryobacteraceae bacterium]|nr:hypothetical protein [Bryobacteraceae bacterium]